MRRRRNRGSLWRYFPAVFVVVLASLWGLTQLTARPEAERRPAIPVAAADNRVPFTTTVENVDVAVEPDAASISGAPTDATSTSNAVPAAAPPARTATTVAASAVLQPVLADWYVPYSPRPLTADAELGRQIAERAEGHTGKLGIAVEDLASGRSVIVDPDTEYQAASLFKLTVMYEVFKQREAGTLSFDENLILTERHVAYDLGTLDRPAGSSIRLGEALERMITISDNSSAILLTDRVGAGNINQDMRAIGLNHTRLVADDLVTSPGDMLTFLEMLARGDGVNEHASAEMVQLLSRQRVNDRIPRLLPNDAIVAHKTGNLPGVVNDVGIVYTPNTTFIVAVLNDGTIDEGRAAQMTADIARMAFEHFRESPAMEVTFPTPGPTSTSRPRTPTVTRVPTPTEEPAPSPVEVVEPPTLRPTRTPKEESEPITPVAPGKTSTLTVSPLRAFLATPAGAIPLTPILGTSAPAARPPVASPQR